MKDTGAIQAITEASQSTSFAAMAQHQQTMAALILKNPAVESVSSFIGVDGANATLNAGRMLISLKPLSQRGISASEVAQRLDASTRNVPGIALFMQPVQDLSIEDRIAKTQYQFTLNSPDINELSRSTAALLARCLLYTSRCV